MTDFKTILKDSPSVGQVHVSSALGGEEDVGTKRRRRDFQAFIGQGKPRVVYPEQRGPATNASDASVEKVYAHVKDLPKPVRRKLKGKTRRQWMHVFNSEMRAHGDEGRAFAGAWSTVKKASGLITRDAFLYMAPLRPKDTFAQCATCRMFLPETGRCAVIGTEVAPDASCGLYVHGEPLEAQPVIASVTAAEAGLVHRQVRCENCKFFMAPKSECALFHGLNDAGPVVFFLNPKVDAKGCCNAQMPGTVEKKTETDTMNPPIDEELETTVNHTGIRATVGPHGDLGLRKTSYEYDVLDPKLHVRRSPAQPLLVKRPLLNGAALRDWALSQGFKTTMDPAQMHVTLAYSKAPVDWAGLGEPCLWVETVPPVSVPPSGRQDDYFAAIIASIGPVTRTVQPLGDDGAVVLRFDYRPFTERNAELNRRGALWKHPNYKAHVSITYGDIPTAVEPYTGPLVFGPEEWSIASDDWKPNYREKRVRKDTWSLRQPVSGDGPGSEILSASPMVGVGGRRLEPYDDGTLHIPFHYDPSGLAYLRPDQVPRVLDAITHPERLPLATTRLDNLVAVKSRVSRKTVQKHLNNLDDVDPPVVCIIGGVAYICDGHDRLAAMWLNGDDECDVRCDDVGPYDDRKPDPKVDHKGSRYDLLHGASGRQLVDYHDGTLAIPFAYDPSFFSHLRPDQVPKFLAALTHPAKLADAVVPMDSLMAIQDRVNADTVASRVEKPSKKPAVIIRMNSQNYIGDGHDRLSAAWLAGADTAKVKMVDISHADNAMKPAILEKRQIAVDVRKVDKDKMQLFGWASVVTKDGRPVLDLQEDFIPVEELEPAVYDYVLNSRAGGDMHETMGVSKCIESMMFTEEKQKALGIDLGQVGWWIGLQYHDKKVWKSVKDGRRPMFSIGGQAISKEVAA